RLRRLRHYLFRPPNLGFSGFYRHRTCSILTFLHLTASPPAACGSNTMATYIALELWRIPRKPLLTLSRQFRALLRSILTPSLSACRSGRRFPREAKSQAPNLLGSDFVCISNITENTRTASPALVSTLRSTKLLWLSFDSGAPRKLRLTTSPTVTQTVTASIPSSTATVTSSSK